MALNQLNMVSKNRALLPLSSYIWVISCFAWFLVFSLHANFKQNDAQVKVLYSRAGRSGQASVKTAEHPRLIFTWQFTETVVVQGLMLSTVSRTLTHIFKSSLPQTRESPTPLCQER